MLGLGGRRNSLRAFLLSGGEQAGLARPPTVRMRYAKLTLRAIQIEIAQGLFDGLILGLLQGFLVLAIQHVFLLAFGFPGIAELVFALLRLLRQDPRGVADIDVRSGPWRRYMREHDG